MHAIPMIGGAHYTTLEWDRVAGAGGFLSHRRPADRRGATGPLDGGPLRRPAIPSHHCRALRTGPLPAVVRASPCTPWRILDPLAGLWRCGFEQRDVWPRLPGAGVGRQ